MPTPTRVDAVGADDGHRHRASASTKTARPGCSSASKPSVSRTRQDRPDAHNEAAEELIGPEWGLHLYDVNIALGNLVNTVAIQTQAYGF